MKRIASLALSGAALTAATAGLAFAHHGFSAYDRDRPVKVTGEVTMVKRSNPHSHIVIKVHNVDEQGQPKQGSTLAWAFETMSAGLLSKLGLTLEKLQNRTVTIEGFRTPDDACTRNWTTLQATPLEITTCKAAGLRITFANGCVLPLAAPNSGTPGSLSDEMAALAANPCMP